MQQSVRATEIQYRFISSTSYGSKHNLMTAFTKPTGGGCEEMTVNVKAQKYGPFMFTFYLLDVRPTVFRLVQIHTPSDLRAGCAVVNADSSF